MTGYGSFYIDKEEYSIEIELKAINHRYTEIQLRVPKEISSLEIELRKLIKDKVIRGKVEANILFASQKKLKDFDINEEVILSYYNKIEDINKIIDNDEKISIYDLIKLPNVLQDKSSNFDLEKIREDVLICLNGALEVLDKGRSMEGEALRKDILIKVDEIEHIVKNICELGDSYIDKYKERLFTNFNEIKLNSNISEERIAIEAGILADKLCIDEELVRLKSHINQVREIFNDSNFEVGRKLDFILQEFNREANTILSKSVDIVIVNYGIELKSLIEKIREQVQNLV